MGTDREPGHPDLGIPPELPDDPVGILEALVTLDLLAAQGVPLVLEAIRWGRREPVDEGASGQSQQARNEEDPIPHTRNLRDIVGVARVPFVIATAIH
jgi:hypothetical protein